MIIRKLKKPFSNFSSPSSRVILPVETRGELNMKKLVLALSIAGFAAGPAFAQMADFAQTDADGNGLITLEEAKAAGFEWTDEQFVSADKDGDGSLSVEEFGAATAG
jgi:Ca2+-binding EF-hand superfamily protein